MGDEKVSGVTADIGASNDSAHATFLSMAWAEFVMGNLRPIGFDDKRYGLG